MQKQDDKKNRVLLLQQSQPTLLAGKPREWYEKLMKDEPKFERKEVPKQKISNSRMQKEQLKALKQLAAASSQGAYYTLGTLEKEETIHPEDIAEVLLECSKTIGDDAIDIFFHISGRLDVELRTSLLVACAENAREPMASMVIRKLDTLPSNIKRMVLKRLCEGYLDSMDSSSLETIETLIECGACEKRLVGMMARLLAREYRQEILAKTSERVFGSTGTTFAFGLLGVAIGLL